MARSMTEIRSLSLTSNPREIEYLLEALDVILEKSKLEELPAFGFRCAVIEVVNNCIRHAYKDEPSHPINITIQLQPGHLTLVVKDRGSVFTGPVGTPQSDPLAESGRGFEIINAGVSKVDFSHQDGWNSCRLEVQIT
jgi:anti-sigma regulatory factor (Ser/Thr protein kinase)